MSPPVNVATTAVHQALELLGRASADWRGNSAAEGRSLHWPVAVNLARRQLARALEALKTESQCRGSESPLTPAAVDTDDARAGIAWWNSLQPAERGEWLEIAGSAVPADAWRAFQAGAERRPASER